MENIIVSASNFLCYLPIVTAYNNRDYLTAGCIAFVSLMSILSHLIENHKHGMPGVGFSTEVSYFLNRMDVLGCIVVISRLFHIYYMKHGLVVPNDPGLFVTFIISFLLLRISEYDKYNPRLKWMYICTHCPWHMIIFPLMMYFLVKHVY